MRLKQTVNHDTERGAHESVKIQCSKVEQRSVIVYRGDPFAIRLKPGGLSIEQAMPGIGKRQRGQDHRPGDQRGTAPGAVRGVLAKGIIHQEQRPASCRQRDARPSGLGPKNL